MNVKLASSDAASLHSRTSCEGAFACLLAMIRLRGTRQKSAWEFLSRGWSDRETSVWFGGKLALRLVHGLLQLALLLYGADNNRAYHHYFFLTRLVLHQGAKFMASRS